MILILFSDCANFISRDSNWNFSNFFFLGRLDVEIEINVPTVKSRQEILTKLLQTTNQSSELTTEDILKVAQAAHGFVGADLHALCRAATDQVESCAYFFPYEQLTEYQQ